MISIFEIITYILRHVSNRQDTCSTINLLFVEQASCLFTKDLLKMMQYLDYNLFLVKIFDWQIYILSKADRTPGLLLLSW